MDEIDFWLESSKQEQPFRKCAHLRRASTNAVTSFSTAQYLRSQAFNVPDMQATGRPLWDNIAAMIKNNSEAMRQGSLFSIRLCSEPW